MKINITKNLTRGAMLSFLACCAMLDVGCVANAADGGNQVRALSTQEYDLFKLVKSGQYEEGKSFVGINDIDVRDADGRTPLFYAARRNYRDMVQALIDRGANPTIKDHFGKSPLDVAGDKVKQMLLDKSLQYETELFDGDIDSTQDVFGRIMAMEYAIDSGRINRRHSRTGDTLLHNAVRDRFQYGVEVLLDHKADVNVVNNAGETPLSIACRNGDADVVRLLLNAGADVEQVPAGCGSPEVLMLLDEKVSQKKNDALFEAVADFNLYRADSNKYKQAIEVALNAGANINAYVNSGKNTVLHMVAAAGFADMVGWLRKKGAQDSANSAGKTPADMLRDFAQRGASNIDNEISFGADMEDLFDLNDEKQNRVEKEVQTNSNTAHAVNEVVGRANNIQRLLHEALR